MPSKPHILARNPGNIHWLTDGGLIWRPVMPRGDKSSYTDKQKRKAEHIEEGYEKRGVSKKEAESRAWATVNKESGGGNKSGSGRGKPDNHEASRKGGRKSGAGQTSEKRSEAAKKGWETRRQKEKG
jgi:plasmid stabilization system protein ParE